MNTLPTVLKAMLEILSMQQAQIKALMTEVELDNQSDFTDADFADLGDQIATLVGTPDTLG